jgi:type IV pilus assembly protein PilN
MRISLNLATRPFVELRPLFARLRLAMAALAVLAIIFAVSLHALKARAAAAEARMSILKARTASFEQEKQRNESRMRQPQNMAVLERSQFLNSLFAEKSFSWTAVMMDLETVLPPGVQVTSLDPTITKEGAVLIRLRVSGDRDRAVQLVRNLERSHRFLAPRLSNESAQTTGAGGSDLAGGPRGVAAVQQAAAVLPGVEFDILSGYNPLPTMPLTKIRATPGASNSPAARRKNGGPR